MQKNPSARRTGAMNILIACCLGLLTPLAALFVFSPDERYNPSITWGAIVDELKSGTMYLHGIPLLLSSIVYSLLALWSCTSFVSSLLVYLHKKPFAKEATLVWAGILFGVTLFLMVGFFALNARCVVLSLRMGDVCTLSVPPA